MFFIFLLLKNNNFFFNSFIFSYLVSLNNKYSELKIKILSDDIIVNSSYEAIQRVSINLPFSLYYFFFIALIYPNVFRADVRYVHYYNFLLFIIHPLLIYFIIIGFPWSDNLVRIHEIGYKISFLALGMFIFSKDHK